MNDERIELKPCPCCGGKPYLANVEMAGCAYVVCTDCRLQTEDGLQRNVAAKWNTRAAIAAMRNDAAMDRLVAEGQRCDAMTPQEARRIPAEPCWL